MAGLYAGTSGWAYPSWKPGFYPSKLAAKKFLEYYATRLNSVELNMTFRRFPTEKQLAAWIAATPAEFVFSVKAHQMITHIKRLAEAGDWTRRFLGALQPLHEAGKLGTVLFQLPPFLKCDLERLDEFISHLPAAIRCTFEFRHKSWFSDEVFERLRNANVALCVAESEDLETPDVVTADFCYYRLRKPEYSPAERKELARKFQGLVAKKSDVFVYFKHEETAEGALYAEELLGRK
jgi:uncharacterized protein YecE (DUF72 family)